MEISHVIRADEWLASTPKHLWLWEAFGIEAPVYAHVPPVFGPDGTKKLSKRDGAKDVAEYLTEGYTAEALMNYLALIGWNDGTEKEFYSKEELIQAFDLGRVQKSGARFDPVKLEWMNGVHIRAMTIDELYNRSDGWWHPAGENFPPEYKKEVLRLNRERLKRFNELSELTWFFFKDPSATPEIRELILNETKLSPETAKEYLQTVLATIEPDSFSEDSLHDHIYGLCEQLKTKPAVLFKLIRISLVGGKNAPGLFETMNVLGKETSTRRLERIVQMFATNPL
jgi:glutamyl-tRNA synthetase